MRNITKAQATKAYRAICERLGEEPQPVADGTLGNRWAYSGKPTLVRDWDWTGARWSVVWEEGPYDWTMGLNGGFTEASYMVAEARGTAPKPEPVLDLPGIMLEPVTGWAVGLYPA